MDEKPRLKFVGFKLSAMTLEKLDWIGVAYTKRNPFSLVADQPANRTDVLRLLIYDKYSELNAPPAPAPELPDKPTRVRKPKAPAKKKTKKAGVK